MTVSDATNCERVWLPIRWPLEPVPDIVHSIRVKLDRPSQNWMPLEKHLTDDERIRAARFRFEDPRRRFIICRSTLRQLLGHCCGIEPQSVPLTYNNHGKPELALPTDDPQVPKVEFSVSHSGEFGLIALAVGSLVGIDVEEFDPSVKILKLAERFFAPQEAAELSDMPPEKQLAGFYRCWTSKEAYIKAKGGGLSINLSSFRVATDPDQPASLSHIDDHPDEPARWTTRALEVAPGYAATVMINRPNCEFACHDAPSDAEGVTDSSR